MTATEPAGTGRRVVRSRVVAIVAGVLAIAALVGFRLDARGADEPTFALAGEGAEHCVVLLHGLARTSASMARLGERLRGEGHATVSVDYPSRKFPVAALASATVPPALAACAASGATTTHVVTHSLGGIVLRRHLADHDEPALGRVVMLAPPNRGSEVVDALGDVPGFALLNGPAGLELGTGADAVPASLGPATVEVAVVTGRRTFNPILSLWLPNPDDGKVSVASARLEGMCAFLVVDVSHPFVMKDAGVIDEVVAYLADGRFADPAAEHLDCPYRNRARSAARTGRGSSASRFSARSGGAGPPASNRPPPFGNDRPGSRPVRPASSRRPRRRRRR